MRLLVLLMLLFSLPTHAEDRLRVAVAANFLPVMEGLAADYQQQTGTRVELVGGSTGAFYEQIRRGAPFDLLYAADAERPDRLAEMDSQRDAAAYACGRLALWTPGSVPDIERLPAGRVAIAQPDTAPYGRAALQALEQESRWAGVAPQIVYAQDIGQAFQYVSSGNATAGFVALSQLKLGKVPEAEYRLVADNEYDPLVQKRVILGQGPERERAKAFADWVAKQGDTLKQAGYRLPGEDGCADR